MCNAHVNTISGSSKLIKGSGRAIILLPKDTKFVIDDALYSTKSQRNLLSFKDIRLNGYHIETMHKKNIEYLYITKVECGNKYVLEMLLTFSSGLYYTHISAIELHVTTNKKFVEPHTFTIWMTG
ncbi:hypothetical protein ES319_A07G185100v1 [Gossypium barbadense]|uniref:Uncharacterized protein n=1 Tax=Gossypium barbadense TaxID=3634 RepID=A0A5J5V4X7_GOSBA|nr:hypothetical protein ES319_A07G185100v1 [Gossypium barbadense]